MAPITRRHTEIERMSKRLIVNSVDLSSAVQIYVLSVTAEAYGVLVIGCTATL